MSLENEDPSPDEGSNKFDEVSKKPKISYSREILLSLSDLDICKKLPSGFDESLLCEFEDAVQNVQDRPRIPGSLPGFRRNEYGSSPPNRGDSNYSRGIYGKWESRSSGRSDRDSESQSDRDSDSGRRYGSRWPRQSEQDGLLGSGSFPRPSGNGSSAPKVRANENYQLSKSNEVYHPPRPYKAVPYSRRDTDAFNDETFGSTECNSEDRAEEERKRRASFELMRKEQQKALQEKQILNPEKHKASDISGLFEASADKKEENERFVRNNDREVLAATPNLGNDLEKSSTASHSAASRPLVPPGFKNNVMEKGSGSKHPIHHPFLKEKPVTGENHLDAEVKFVQNGINDGLEKRLSQEIGLVDGQPVESTFLLDKRENVNLHASLDVYIGKSGMEDHLPHTFSRLDSHGTLDDPEIVHKTVGNPDKKNSTSILGEIFSSTLSVTNGSGSAEHYDGKQDDTRSPNSVRPSKIAQWFYDGEAKAADDISHRKPNSLLSLIVSGDKVKNQAFDPETEAEQFSNDLFSNTLEESKKLTLNLPSAADESRVDNKEEAIPSVLTCEDLEQSMLTEYSTKSTNVQPPLNISNANTVQSKTEHIDDHASLHLLSLLQKGTDQSNVRPTAKPLVSHQHDMGLGPTAVNESKGKPSGKNIPVSGDTLTLQSLFGSAFMKELQSVGAPVSAQRGPTPTGPTEVEVSGPHGLLFPGPNHPQEVPTGFGEFQLPVENSHRMSKFMVSHNSTDNVNFSSTAPIDIMARVRPLYNNHLESDLGPMSPQMKFLHQEPMMNRDSPPNHQFPSNMIHRPFHHPNVGMPRLDVPSQHPMLRQMQMSSNNAPHLLPEFARAGPVSHPGNQAAGFIPEMNQVHGFPLGPSQMNVGNRGLPIPAPGINSGGGPPEAFQRLVEMKLLGNTDRNHPAPPGVPNQGIYGREVRHEFAPWVVDN